MNAPELLHRSSTMGQYVGHPSDSWASCLHERPVVPRTRCLIRVPIQQSTPTPNKPLTYNNSGLSLYLLNASGLSKQHAVEHLAADFNSYDVDIAVITETHFCAKHTDSIRSVTGYTLYRRDRSIRNKSGRRMKGGGVAAYVRSTVQSTVWKYSRDDPTYELLWVRCGSMIIGALYNPPKPQYDPELLVQYIEACLQELACVFPTADVVIAGDFNQLPETRVVASTGFTQIVRQPTRGANVLDQIFVSDPFLYDTVRVITSVVKSDHKAIVLYSERRKVTPANKSTRVRYRKVTPGQHAALLQHVTEDEFINSTPPDNVQTAFDNFYTMQHSDCWTSSIPREPSHFVLEILNTSHRTSSLSFVKRTDSCVLVI